MFQTTMTRCLVTALFVTCVTVSATADDSPVKIGSAVGHLTFKDIRYLPHSLDEFRDRKAVVLVFTTTTCPLVQRYLPALGRLDAEFRDRGVQFVAVNVGPDDSITDIAEQAVRYKLEFPFVKDFDADAARSLGVSRTPEAVVIDAEKRLRYRGRIDDQYRLDGVRQQPTRQDLRAAIESVLAGQPVEISETPVDGCLITSAKPIAPIKSLNYAEHIAPIVAKHCTGCHRPGTVAPFSLTSHRAVAARAEMIAEVIREERMPPWYASRKHTEFLNRRGLSPDERERVLGWIRAGAPRGETTPTDEDAAAGEIQSKPKPQQWLIGEPDLALTVPKPYDLPADGVIAYQYVLLPYVFPNDTWVEAIQIKPDNHRVVHHCNLAYVNKDGGFRASNFLTGVVPGGDPMRLDNGVAVLIPKGATLVLQIHYVTTGKPEQCEISVGLRYPRDRVQKQLRHIRLEDTKFEIAPGSPAHPVANARKLDRDAIGIGLFSHMHLRGKDMTFLAHLPEGTTQEMLMIPNYSFNWQHSYRWEFGKFRLPKDTRVECLAHYDNSTFNPFNPDATVAVKEGPQTFHEMMNGFFFYVDAAEQLQLEVDPKTGAARAETAGR